MKKTHIIGLILIAIAIGIILITTGDASTYVGFEEAEKILKTYRVDFIFATTKTYLDRSGLLEQSGYEFFEKKFAKKIKE